MSTMQSIHGHEVIHLVHGATPPLSRDGLRAEAARRWGELARFHTCSAANMTVEELLTFLMDHGKVVEGTDGILRVNFGNVCEDGQEEKA